MQDALEHQYVACIVYTLQDICPFIIVLGAFQDGLFYGFVRFASRESGVCLDGTFREQKSRKNAAAADPDEKGSLRQVERNRRQAP